MKLPVIRAAALLSIVIPVLFAGGASAQIMGPLMPESALELGARLRWVEADMEQSAELGYVDQQDLSFPFRYGVTRYFTLSAELFVGNEDTHSLEYDLKYYTLGGGFQALVWENDDYLVSGGVHFSEMLVTDRSGDQCDREQFTLLAIMQVQRTFQYRNQDITVWGGGVQYYFSDDRIKGNYCTATGYHNAQTLGVALGANLLLIDHVQLYYHFIYVDYYQPRVGVSYRF